MTWRAPLAFALAVSLTAPVISAQDIPRAARWELSARGAQSRFGKYFERMSDTTYAPRESPLSFISPLE